jgi:ankyrin repeat protein
MTHTRILARIVCIGSVSLGGAPAVALAEPVAAQQVRDAATRAVALLQSSQKVWYEKQACSSCHQQFQPAIALVVARAHGVAVDESIDATNTSRAFNFSDIDGAIQFTNVVEPALQQGYRMIAAHAAGIAPSLGTALSARFLLARQRPAGDWSGINQRPPSSSSDFAKTAYAMRAIQLFHHRADTDAAATAVRRASAWLASHEAPDTEGLTFRLLGLHWAGADRATLARAGRQLLAIQRADGGWGSVDGRASEAYSTGEALVALGDTGIVEPSDAVYQRGLTFLLQTQAADGSWHVPSRLHDPARVSPPYFESGYPYGHDQFISAAGAAWSIMALAEALPPVNAPTRTMTVAPATAAPWIETVIFGSLADLRQLLDEGLDPNATTPEGKTTALMMAAGDAGKLALLLDRGAQVDRRAISGFTALTVAAQYTHSDAAIGLLLDRGASVQSDTSGRPVPFHALGLAAHAGNASILERLHRAGDPVDRPFRLSASGGGPTAMEMAVRDGNLEVVRTLLDLGAELEGARSQEWSSLEVAVLNNRLDLVRLFLDRGANINMVDKAGYTPLLLAASIDFGETAMLELLLASGARADARSPAGKTALDLAREYQHTRFTAVLERAAQRGH